MSAIAAPLPSTSLTTDSGFVRTRHLCSLSTDFASAPEISTGSPLPPSSQVSTVVLGGLYSNNMVSSPPSELNHLHLNTSSKESRFERPLPPIPDTDAGPSHQRGASEGRSDEAHTLSGNVEDMSPIASSLSSTPRAASPSFSQQHSDSHNSTPTSERANGKFRAFDMLVPASITGLALQVQSAVSRNVTSPLVRVLTDAEQVNEQNGLPICSNISEASPHLQSTTHSSGSSNYASASGSPSLEALSQEQSKANHNQRLDSSLPSVGTDVIDLGTTPAYTATSIEKHESSSGTDSAATNQSDISRTPSTSTTGSSHASSLDTAISSVVSSSDLDSTSQKPVLDDGAQSLNTLRINTSSHLAPATGQVSPASINSETDGMLVSLADVSDLKSTEAASAEAKLTIAKVRRYAALLELVDTERNYADDLATLVLVFFDNLCLMPFFNDSPARQALVTRNAKDLLRTHQKLSAKLEGILIDLELRKTGSSSDDGTTDLEKALSPQADEAVVRVAKLFHQMMPSLECYKIFCSRHGEALALIREAERRQTEWDAYEKHCAEILKYTPVAPRASSRSASGSTTPNYSAGSAAFFTPVVTPHSPSSTATGSTLTVAPLGQTATRQPSSRLLLRDFLIKPIQRLCLYPLVLQTLQKHSLATGAAADELSLAISLMREVADQVDEAGRRRESELRADLILSRVELCHGITLPFVRSLGDCQLSGTLDVLHHHAMLAPLVAPLHFKYLGIFLYNGFVLMVKVRKNAVYECRHWFPLWAARLCNVEEGGNLIPHSFRLSVADHHFELAASNVKERQLWVDLLSVAISRASTTQPGAEPAFPSSLFLGDAADFGIHDTCEAPTPNASRAAEVPSYFETNKSPAIDPLMGFLASHALGSVQSTTQTTQRGHRPPSNTYMPTEILLKHASSNSRSIVDRGMVLSEAVITARIAKDSGAMSTLYAASGSGLGSTVGSSLGLNRLSNRETSTVKIQRRGSSVGFPENVEDDEDANNLVFTATLLQPGVRSRTSSRGNTDSMSDRESWRASLLRKAGRGKSSNALSLQSLTCNTSELGPPVWLVGSASTPTSPTVISKRDSPAFDAGPSGSALSSSGNENTPFSLPSSPVMGHHSAGSSTVNLRMLGAMPARSRSSLYGVRDSLSASFAKRGRTQSAQAGDYAFETGVSSAMSSLAPSPISSNLNLPQGSATDQQESWPSTDNMLVQRQGRSRTNSISSVTGSIRRALTSGPLRHRKSQSDAAKLYAASALYERQMPMLGSGPMVAEPSSLDESSSNSESASSQPASSLSMPPPQSPQSPRSGSLRRSKTMLSSPKTWFRASAPSTSLEKIHAEAMGTVSPPLRGQRSFVRPTTPASGFRQSDWARPLRSRTSSEGLDNGVEDSGGHRRSSDTQLTTIREQKPETGSPDRRGSKMLNSLRFLQTNRFSPMPMKAIADTTVSPVSHSPTSSPSGTQTSSPRRRLSGRWA